ncbi:hypothetical protein PGT21_005675 [Puccinia graminis f. sp. tritici]|uniref:Uncharacterized protein n=1 Tax=Puccinia graminis f. sp. tritici TaxID=56615 RepID=A0A5B0NAB0_PUCGR|nr:hypothetical protein PGT21_006690 [Puccinia graminis f. sp. tritici]KAA1085394.1 hypothetical protein PGT21_005675 [Puccinia graminis f. sp. tritici]KAA1129940.1 hypothetical protein PGTUg99_008349 [Puccinia graminis f. sp. tritici]
MVHTPWVRPTGSRIVTVVNNGPPRRPQVRRTPTQREVEDEACFNRNVRNGQRLGVIPEAPNPQATPTKGARNSTSNTVDPANHPIPDNTYQDPHWTNEDPHWEDKNPLLAHATLH